VILPPDAGIDRGLSRAIRIAVSGLTSAGKTTHSKLLAAHYKVPYVAMLPVMTAVLNERYPGDDAIGSEWTPARDIVRETDDDIDREADRRMKLLLESGPGVFDAWALPWLDDSSDVVRVWIDSDQPSRARKCYVSALMKHVAPSADPMALIEGKDSFAYYQFLRLYGFSLAPDPAVFDVILDNSELMPRPDVDSARAGIAAFQPRLVAAIDGALGLR
jgi:cytidylate kinase